MSGIGSDEMARIRTALAADRTLIAWVRTALSMISFGFTITKFFQYLQQSEHAPFSHGPRNLGLTLTALGIAGVLIGVLQHNQILKRVNTDIERKRMSVSVVAALGVAVVGIIVFVSVLARVGPF